jgi:hypothetical protein
MMGHSRTIGLTSVVVLYDVVSVITVSVLAHRVSDLVQIRRREWAAPSAYSFLGTINLPGHCKRRYDEQYCSRTLG